MDAALKQKMDDAIWAAKSLFDRNKTAEPEPVKVSPEKETGGKASYGKEQRRRKAALRSEIKAAEDGIEELGTRIEELEAEITNPEVLRDHILLQQKCDELEKVRVRQQELFDKWETLLEEQEELEGDNA